VIVFSPLAGLATGASVILAGATVWWWEPDRWGKRAGKRVIELGVLQVVIAAALLYLLPGWGIR
jgi:hypothetical protein